MEVKLVIITTISAIESDSDREFMLDIYKRYNTLIRRTIYNVVNNSKDIEDLTNDTYIKLIEKISTISALPRHKLTTYVVYTSKNTAINYLKHRDVMRKHLYYGDEYDVSEEMPDTTEEFEEKIMHQVDIEDLCKSIKSLPERQKDILYYKYFLDMTDADIARSLGKSTDCVRQYLKRARDAAKLLVGKEAVENVNRQN